MKPILTLVLSFFLANSFAQKYSKAVKDSSILNFMTWLLQSDTSFKDKRHVDNDILKLHPNNFIFSDSLASGNYLYAENIFSSKNQLKKYFNHSDAEYFVQQIEQQRKAKWQLKIKGIELFDTIELVNNRADKVLYSYSLPLFSVDRKHVIIIEAFYCGLVCGGGDYNLYERQADNSWKRIKQFNHWDE